VEQLYQKLLAHSFDDSHQVLTEQTEASDRSRPLASDGNPRKLDQQIFTEATRDRLASSRATISRNLHSIQ